MGRPHQLVDLDTSTSAAQIADWIRQLDVQVLNVAGPRESEAPGIYARAFELVSEILANLSTCRA